MASTGEKKRNLRKHIYMFILMIAQHEDLSVEQSDLFAVHVMSFLY